MCINIYIAMCMLLIVPKQSEMDDQLGAPSQHQKSFYIYEEECIFLVKCFMVYVLFWAIHDIDSILEMEVFMHFKL